MSFSRRWCNKARVLLAHAAETEASDGEIDYAARLRAQDQLQVASQRAAHAEAMMARMSIELAGLRLRHDSGVSAHGDDLSSLGGSRDTLNFAEAFSGGVRIGEFPGNEEPSEHVELEGHLSAAAEPKEKKKRHRLRKKGGSSGDSVCQTEEAGAQALGSSSA